MNLPGFNAEVSVYKTNNHYRVAAGGSSPGDGNATVVPQGCGWLDGILCGGLIAGGIVVCTASCLASPALGGFPCWLCWTGFLGFSYPFCKDCIPAWMQALIDEFESGGGSGGGGGGGGGGGVAECCPSGRRCCGSCVKVSGGLRCDGACVGANQECP